MLRRALATIALSALLPALAFSQSTEASFWGSTADLRVGTSMDEVGDINNDGYFDMVVGAPYPSGSGRLYFVNGKYLATGNGVSTLGSTFDNSSGAEFGTKVISVGDVTGDGIHDVVAIRTSGSFVGGSASLVSGASKAIIETLSGGILNSYMVGLSRCGDVNGDGYTDFAIQAFVSGNAAVQIVSARAMYLNATNPVLGTIYGYLGEDFGAQISSGDFDGDGKPEIVIGAPDAVNDAGNVYIYRGSNHSLLRMLSGSAGSHFGASLDASRDVDGDGRKDLLVGAPYSNAGATGGGRVTLYNGKRVALNTFPFEDAVWTGTQANAHFGAAVCFTPDTNADSITDIVVGAPDHDATFVSSGRVFIYSGETSHLLGAYSGVGGERLGTSVSRAWDYNGNLRYEVAAGAPLSNYGATDGGLVRFISLFPAVPSTYCVAKVNSLGCTPAISFSGSPSLSSSSSFLIKASQVLNNKAGLLIYAFDVNAAPFQGGTLCLGGPIKRYGAQISGGTPPPNNCTGTMSTNFNVLIQSGSVAALNTAGQQVFAQYWGRDSAAVAGSSLTNALAFVVNP